MAPVPQNECGRLLTLRHLLDEPHDVALGVLELAELDHVHDLLRAHYARAAESLGPCERLLHIGYRHVEGDVTLVAGRATSDAAADSDAVRADVLVARDHAVLHGVVR